MTRLHFVHKAWAPVCTRGLGRGGLGGGTILLTRLGPHRFAEKARGDGGQGLLPRPRFVEKHRRETFVNNALATFCFC